MKTFAAHFFRHEYGRLVAMLARRIGVHYLEAVEDAVQFALSAAVETWPKSSVPENPSAWLFRVAHNRVVGELRRSARRAELAVSHGREPELEAPDEPRAFLDGDVRDDLLRMLFVCCDAALPLESQLVLALEVLCGFNVREISERLFMSEHTVYKRLNRARRRLRDDDFEVVELTSSGIASRLPAVRAILYVLFTEGYLSSHAAGAIRRELCDEAMRLTTDLAAHTVGAVPETFALLALMHLHSARMTARQDESGGLLLLEEQDRSLWNASEVETGLAWLARSAEGEVFSRYHAEAGIAAEHCLAPTFAETRWGRIVDCYELLERTSPSALHTLNRAVAVAEHLGPIKGLAVLERMDVPAWLERSHVWHAVRAYLQGRCGQVEIARQHAQAAIDRAPSQWIADALERRLAHFITQRGDGSALIPP
jgi:RNA polymerase sigma factor (sigma-70 family)